MTDVTGKTALITGGSSGIGPASARTFRNHNARVAIAGRNAERLVAARGELWYKIAALLHDGVVPFDQLIATEGGR